MSTTTNLGITHLEAGVRQPEIVINDALNTIDTAFGSWQAYVPTWTNLSVGNGTVTARYIKINDTVFVRIAVVFGSTTSISGSVSFTLPLTRATYAGAVGTTLGPCRLYDQSVPTTREGVIVTGTTTTAIVGTNDVSGTYPTAVALSSTVPFTWTTSDEILMQFSYEAA